MLNFFNRWWKEEYDIDELNPDDGYNPIMNKKLRNIVIASVVAGICSFIARISIPIALGLLAFMLTLWLLEE